MTNGANSFHKQLRKELENYIKSQYFGKSPLLLSALKDELDKEMTLYKEPFIESSPAYVTVQNGFEQAEIEPWMKKYFLRLAESELGVYTSPFKHQIKALEEYTRGKDLFVSTGTGSGKTECFMWPIVAKMADEARNSKQSWKQQGIRTIIMYPMNALVADQISRLRKMVGDPGNKFIDVFRETCGQDVRRPRFGMYTGRTPYPGVCPTKKQDRDLENTLKRISFPEDESARDFYYRLLRSGKIPAKKNMEAFCQRLHESKHIPDPEDAELITRFEMQQFCPDIMITNYSMLEYMLLRPIEQKIWSDTRNWLASDLDNKLLFVIDEAHMYRGSSGGEVALLIRRLFHKLGIGRDRVQFILTTASMPNKDKSDRDAVMCFADELSASDGDSEFCYLTGEKEEINGCIKYDISDEALLDTDPGKFESDEKNRLSTLLSFWKKQDGFDKNITTLEGVCNWMYYNLVFYRPFNELIKRCRGNAISLNELSSAIFPNLSQDEALTAVSVLLAMVPLAKNLKGAVLFPARMHMLFRGIPGVYACANETCEHANSGGGLTLGKVFLSDGKLVCPKCGSVVYELYNDRRCGALFFKGYILDDNADGLPHGNMYLWRYPGHVIDSKMKEVHLYIPDDGFELPRKHRKNEIKSCYLDVKSGFVNFSDDSLAGKPGIRKLYWCNYSTKGKPEIFTFPSCPHCKHQLSSMQLTSFSTRGNQPFYNLIKSQFNLQPAVPEKADDREKFPNEGRKVLLFSDSRQQAAKLARDMSEFSDMSVSRQLFALAIKQMDQQDDARSLDYLYGYFCLAAGQRHVQMFHNQDRKKFKYDRDDVLRHYERRAKRKEKYYPQKTISNHAPDQLKEEFLRLFSGGYNTFYDSAISWIEPTDDALDDALDVFEENNILVSDESFIGMFNAWIMSICDRNVAIGHSISDTVRMKARPNYGEYGLDKNWAFSGTIKSIMGWDNDNEEERVWKQALEEFLSVAQSNNGKLYVDLSKVRAKFGLNHEWFKCEQCSEVTPFTLKDRCPCCGSFHIHKMKADEYDALSFWRDPISSAVKGDAIHVMDTEEHTAQLSHKDQRDELWSKTEQYELRFQDLIREGETPVDILSSTTTMEVGIDIGSLVAVGLRNVPPMRENYQQRAGRAGRRGSSLSTIVTFCEDGPHDSLYFNDPTPMFRGEPRKPWIDVRSEKLLKRHLAMILLQEFLAEINNSLDGISASDFLERELDKFEKYLYSRKLDGFESFIPLGTELNYPNFSHELVDDLKMLKEKCKDHPELFGIGEGFEDKEAKKLLDALYEEGIIPTYSFPKNVVSTYIANSYGKIEYEIERGLDIAIGEYAPGRAIVVDKQTYQIGGFYSPGSEHRSKTPARAYMGDPNYIKSVLSCDECGWFGLDEDNTDVCPFCGNKNLTFSRKMLRPWGFAPKNAESIPEVQLSEEYTAVQQPLYSTLPSAEDMKVIPQCKNIKIASRTNQRIIMLNKGSNDRGFMVCEDCGAAMPGDNISVLENIKRPFRLKNAPRTCNHKNAINVNLGYDFVTDMLVLEFRLDDDIVDTHRKDNLWLVRAAQSLAEALRLAASKRLDVEFTELVTGYRLRTGEEASYIDVYLYDSLSSGAGYAISVADSITELLADVQLLLTSCNCDTACFNCLKHYRNQYVHGLLDRKAALQLLKWGVDGEAESDIDFDVQKKMITPLINILRQSGCDISINNGIEVTGTSGKKKITIYPAMLVEPHARDTIFVRDIDIKYAKPYAVKKILDSI